MIYFNKPDGTKSIPVLPSGNATRNDSASMKKTHILTPDQTVAEVVEKYPETARVWIALETECLGCWLMRFCTLEYVAESYDLDLETLIDELERAIRK